jgi:ferritin-like metal-binding protein YciE
MESKNVLSKAGKKDNKSNKNTSSTGSRSQSSDSSTGSFSDNNKENTLEKVFETLLKDIYTAELELVDALPKVMEAAYEEDFEDAVRDHLEETKRQVKRLEKIFTQLHIDKDDAEICEAMSALIGETTKIINEFEGGPVRDSALIICAQKVEHYEIAAYGSLRTLADVLGMEQIGDVLDRSLEEEKAADELLSELAEDINEMACDYSDSEYESQSWTSGRE